MTSLPPPAKPTVSPYRWLIAVLFILILALLAFRVLGPAPATFHRAGDDTGSLRKYSVVPPFSLTERSGRQITNHDLSGKVWVADFVYTTCPGPCPLVTANMARLQNALANDPNVQLVTFTVDPQTDTPAVLAKYANQFGADPNKWWFLTGPEKPLYDLIQNGFLQPIQDNRGQPQQEGQFTVTHSTYFALVDADGNVRGFYDGAGPGDRPQLLHDIKALEDEATQNP